MILVITPEQINLYFYLLITNAHYETMSHRKCHTTDQLFHILYYI